MPNRYVLQKTRQLGSDGPQLSDLSLFCNNVGVPYCRSLHGVPWQGEKWPGLQLEEHIHFHGETMIGNRRHKVHPLVALSPGQRQRQRRGRTYAEPPVLIIAVTRPVIDLIDLIDRLSHVR